MSEPAEIETRVRTLIRDREIVEAASVCSDLNRRYPEYASGWAAASQVALLAQDPAVAIRAIDNALALEPGNPEWLLKRIECMGAMQDKAGAIELAQQLATHQFDDPVLCSQFAYALSKLGLFELALIHYERACELRPEDSRHFYNLATAQRFLGDIDAAESSLATSIRLNPDDADAHLLRASLQKRSTDSANIETLEAAYKRAAGKPESRARLCYALAKELDDVGEFSKAFEYLAEGSRLRRQQARYNPAADLETIHTIRTCSGPGQFKRGTVGHINAEPIFVIGMPRSGTTLIERVLSCHSVVTSVGEKMTFPLHLMQHCKQVGGSPARSTAELLARSMSIDFAALGEDYIAASRAETDGHAHFVDTLPLNFLYAGIIHLALPKAKIVLLERDPRDTCFAVFRTLFDRVYPFSYDLVELANYFVAYRQLTDHWLDIIPDAMHRVRYEELVSDPQPVIENLLDYCDLSFEENCVRFYDSKSPATSMQAAQARRAFSKASIGDWRNYEKQMKPLVDILSNAGLLET